jgi:hypothetical protein
MRRRHRRNKPLTVRVGGKKYTWRGLVKRHGVKAALRKWRGKRKYHGWTKTRVAANPRRRRRRRSRNSWKGARRRHARAAKKGWRKRRGSRSHRKYGKRRGRRCGRRTKRGRCVYSRRSFKGAIKYGGKFYSRRTLVNKIGKKRLRKLYKRRGRKVSFNRGKRRRRSFRRRK